MSSLKHILIGRPMASNELGHQKLPKWKALPMFSSDALSSVAYAQEEILLALTIAGTGLLHYSLPIGLAIFTLLVIVTISYRQIIKAFPSGGGAYIVAREHIGEKTSLVAGASLMFDYILTVAVSICSGVAALTSAFPSLLEYRVPITIAVILVLMLMNLRGISESATIFAFPTYLFILSILILVVVGVFKLVTGGWHGYENAPEIIVNQELTNWTMFFLVLRAFSGGCSAMTGVEAISNGVPSFREPHVKNANKTLLIMSGLLGVMFLGIVTMSIGFGVLPIEHKTVISQIAAHVFGNSIFFYLFQMVTMLILFLAANTSFAGFPQLSSVIARDGFLPRSLAARGDRLVFSNGITLLAGMAIILVLIFQGETHALIPLYAVGVFLSFTIAQVGLMRKSLTDKDKARHIRLFTSTAGAIVTGTVTIVTLISKFSNGAWLIVIIIPAAVYFFERIHAHYKSLAKQIKLTGTPGKGRIPKRETKVIIPVSGVSKIVDRSISYAKIISSDIRGLAIVYDKEAEKEIRAKWEKWYPDIKLDVIQSPYRTIVGPMMQYIKKLEDKNKRTFVTVLLPQFIVKKWWHAILHNQTAYFLRFILILKRDVVIATMPFHLHE